MGWLFGKKKEAKLERESRLLEKFLQVEEARISRLMEAENKRMEHDLKLREIEIENAEAIQAAKKQEALWREEVREKKRENMAKARAAKKTQPQHLHHSNTNCRVCLTPGAIDLTAEEILWHNAGHVQQQELLN